jgi:cation:H+ antiporter
VAGISPLVVGLTVVAFGTSAPELAVSIKASLGGQTDIAVGNVVGSNILNILFILGISALISPLTVASQLIRTEVPLMIAASILMLLLGLDGTIQRIEGIGLFAALVCYVIWTVRKSRKERVAVKAEFEEAFPEEPRPTLSYLGLQVLLIIGGLVLLAFGARWIVDGSTTIARMLGMSELLIGLTIIALGTSLPEAAASIVASIRGERDIAVGNVVGSNLFNILCVLGLTAAVVPDGVDVSRTALRLDIPVMIAVAVACLPIFFTGHRIARWEGALFLGYYIAYTSYLIVAAAIPSFSRTFAIVMLLFVVPLTTITLLIGAWRSLRKDA